MSTQKPYWSALWHQPAEPHSLLSRYIVANGILYLAAGAAIYLLPASVLIRVFFLEHLTGYEEGLARAVGVTLLVIGWLYVMGGRTRAESFSLGTVVDRFLIPVLLIPLWLLGMAPPGMMLPFAILDPVPAVGAYAIWRRES
jgi:hypothetical protein